MQIEARSREITHHKTATVLNACYDSKGKARPKYLGFGYFFPGAPLFPAHAMSVPDSWYAGTRGAGPRT